MVSQPKQSLLRHSKKNILSQKKAFLIFTKVIVSLHSPRPVNATIDFKVPLLTYKAWHRLTPHYIADLLTPSAQPYYSLAGCERPRLSPPFNGNRWGQSLHLPGPSPLRQASCKCQKRTPSWYSSADPRAICSVSSFTLNPTCPLLFLPQSDHGLKFVCF